VVMTGYTVDIKAICMYGAVIDYAISPGSIC